MVRFKIQMRGYDKKEVDAYIHKTNEFAESKIRELENCIERLKEENDYLYAKNSEYRRNEERVSAAIVKAMEVKQTLEEELRAKIELEEDRLRIFKEKWVAYAAGLTRGNADRSVSDINEYIRLFCETFIKGANREIDIRPSSEGLSAPEISYLNEQQRIQKKRRGRKPKASVTLRDSESSEPKTPA